MSSLWMVVIGLWCSVALMVTGCGSGGARPPVSANVHLAFPRAVSSSIKRLPRLINGLGGGIVVVTDRSDEISADVMAAVLGSTVEAARIRAGRRITVTNNADKVEVSLLPDAGGKDPDSQFSAVLRVAVPQAIELPGISTPSGNIEVYGNVGNVTAVISDRGDIEIRGADGNMNLSTQRGSITADILRGHDIALRAVDGNIDLHAVEALVSAATTNKDIRFNGTLRAGQTHYFTTTAAGGIQVTLPDYPAGYPTPQIYRSHIVTSASPVNVEFPARSADGQVLPICGFIHSDGPYDYHVENSPAGMGRIEVAPVVTGTYFFNSVLATNYFRFDTDQTRVAFYTPLPHSIHMYTAAQLKADKESITPECRPALDGDSPSAIVLNLKSDRGPVSIQQMRMLNK